jgi:hypothetical protein
MRILSLLTLLCLLAPATQALAQTPDAPALTRGVLPDTRTSSLPEPTKEEITEANAVGTTCRISNEQDYYDCDCIALTYLQQRVLYKAINKTFDEFAEKENAKKACPNPTAIAGRSYTTCMSWAPRMRQDYESFCECYGNAYAEAFSKNPAITYQDNKYVMAAALNNCDVGAPIVARINRNARIREMELSGVYDEMYPSAINRSKPIGPQPGDPKPSQLAAWQKMQRMLFDTDTRRDTSRQ